jgi:alanine racemase
MTVETESPYIHRPTFIEVYVDRLRQNFRTIRNCVVPSKVMASIKANGYGHGLVTVGKTLQEEGVDALGVAFIEEGIELRKAGITTPILVFGGLLQEQLDLYIQYDIEVTAPSVSKISQINESAKRLGRRARVHLKIDTGLERIGVHHYNAQSLFDAALRADHCDIVGVFSHFADVQPDDLTVARMQLDRFLGCLRYFESRANAPFVRHIANSAAVLAFPESHLDMVRPGIALYGVYPEPTLRGTWGLQPSLSLKSQVVYFKVVQKGAGVSYGHTWYASQDTRVITVPIGYGDGYLRTLSNKGLALVRGGRYPVIGKVCMDQMMVDISPAGEAYNGDEVVLIGKQGDQSITVEDLALAVETTPHDILVSLNSRIPRIVVPYNAS